MQPKPSEEYQHVDIRAYREADLEELISLTVESFRPFFEDSFPQMVGHDQDLIAHQHGHWQQDYRELLPTLHHPEEGKHLAVATDAQAQIMGFIAWKPDQRPRHAEIDLLVVSPSSRRRGAGSALLQHAMNALRDEGYGYVGLGTGGDAFHEPARRLYESNGFHPIPIVGYLRRL